jgi:membrane-associated phospholipid phosphatase
VSFAAFAGFDSAVSAAIDSMWSPALTRVMWVITVSGDSPVMIVWTALAVILLWVWGRRRPAIVLAALMALDPLVVAILKGAFARTRPPAGAMLVAPPSGLSFPSGHATAALLFYGLLALFAVLDTTLGGWQKALMVTSALGAAFLVGVSRVYLGVHFPSDVVAGWAVAVVLVGLGWGALTVWERQRRAAVVRGAGQLQVHRVALAVTSAAIAVGVFLVQTGLDPLY